MAQFGAKCPMFAPFVTEPDAALPTYGSLITVGALVKADLTINLASGELYADDTLKEQLSEFASGAIALETDDMTDSVAQVIYGATAGTGDNGELLFNKGDTPPYGGFGYYKALMRGGAKVYKACYYPKVRAALGNDSAATRGNSITFGTTPTALTVFACNTGDWRVTKEFAGGGAEALALSWIREKLGGNVLGELTVTSAPSASTSGSTKLTVSPTKTSGNSYKYKTSASVTLPAYDDVCSTGYTAWDGMADIVATTGQKILVVEVDGSNKAKKAGIATVASKA